MSLKPFFTYFGGKFRIAPRYPKPEFKYIIEPFAGSAGYSMRYPQNQIILYEENTKVFGTWEYLLRVSEAEVLNLPLVFADVRELKIPQEAKWLIGWWLNKGHTMPCHIPGQWMRRGDRPNSFWGEIVRSRISSQLQYIRHWKIHNKSYENCPGFKACWFIDPPYQRSGRCYPINEINYESLSNWCRLRKGQVIVCEQFGADWLPFEPFIETRGTAGYKMPGTSKEMIWTNNV